MGKGGMMRKQLFLTIALLCFCFTACNDDGIIVLDDFGTKKDTTKIHLLTGTEWRLVEFSDIEKNKLLEKFFGSCFTLYFIDSMAVNGRGISNKTVGYYYAEVSSMAFKFTMFQNATLVGGYNNEEDLYIETMRKVESFSLNDEELKLFYNNKKDYLLFVRI